MATQEPHKTISWSPLCESMVLVLGGQSACCQENKTAIYNTVLKAYAKAADYEGQRETMLTLSITELSTRRLSKAPLPGMKVILGDWPESCMSLLSLASPRHKVCARCGTDDVCCLLWRVWTGAQRWFSSMMDRGSVFWMSHGNRSSPSQKTTQRRSQKCNNCPRERAVLSWCQLCLQCWESSQIRLVFLVKGQLLSILLQPRVKYIVAGLAGLRSTTAGVYLLGVCRSEVFEFISIALEIRVPVLAVQASPCVHLDEFCEA
eukprot:2378710-Amphidinium_carterae.1